MAALDSKLRAAPRAIAAALAALVDSFVPPTMAADREAANRARMFLISHLCGPILGNTALAALYVFDPTPHYDILILWLSISLFWAFPFLLRSGISYDRLVVLSVVNLNFCILYASYQNGGAASPTISWALIIPILSLFYLGGDTRLQARVLGITALSFGAFFLAYILLEPPANDIPDAAMFWLGAVSTVATLCYVAMMAIYYSRIFDAGVDLEIEVRRRRQLTDELRREIVKSHRVESAKGEFLARMSHEIRTPLNAIIGYGQILREDAEDTNDRQLMEDIDRILDAAHYLVRLTNMILDLAKLDAGRMRFDLRPHRLVDILNEAIAGRRDLIGEGGNQVALEMAPGLDEVVVDANRVTQLVDALLENAAQHTRDGRIMVRASQGVSHGHPVFSIAVSDTGTGIPPETIATIFETFSTGRSAATGRYGGTGISLSVSQALCRAMGGVIAVESRAGEGSTFTITLPRGHSMEARAAA